MPVLQTLEALDALYGPPAAPSVVKVLSRLNAEYGALIAASPFAALATCGPRGLDCSPRGDAGEVVRILDDRTLAMPDRRGNNRADSLRNIIADPRVALLFLIPGSGSTLRVNGTAQLRTDADLVEMFRMDGHAPRCAILIAIQTVFFQCARAVIRADLWNPARHVDPARLPTAGQMLAAASDGAEGGDAYDADWPGRAAKSMW